MNSFWLNFILILSNWWKGTNDEGVDRNTKENNYDCIKPFKNVFISTQLNRSITNCCNGINTPKHCCDVFFQWWFILESIDIHPVLNWIWKVISNHKSTWDNLHKDSKVEKNINQPNQTWLKTNFGQIVFKYVEWIQQL